ncbi:MAG: hypothetical protein JSU04_00995 [Bdellovibrionales bacterium]|nr:hypothetical protein [Bdellovibrionales bacterium]
MRILLALLLLLCTACSRIEIAKRWGDTFLWWQVNDLVEYSSAVKAEARKQTDQMYATIQAKGFPAWAEQMEAFKAKVEAKSLKQEDVSNSMQELRKQFEQLGKDLQPNVLALIDLMGEKEFQNLIRNYRKKIEKEQSEAEDVKSQREAVEERYVSAIEFFVGSLIGPQEKLIKDFMTNEPYPYQLQLKNKRRYLEMIEATKGDKEKLKSLAKDFSVINSSLEAAEFHSARAAYVEKMDQLTFKVLEQMTEKQRKHLSAKLGEVAKVLRDGKVPL